MTIFLVIRSFIEYMLFEAIFWFVTLGGIASLFIAFGMPQNIASGLAIAISLGLLVLVLYIAYTISGKTKLTKNKTQGEVRLAHSIARLFADSSSTEWSEYQDWLHDILLARRQLLDTKCPRWKVKLITYKRLTVFCVVVGISKVRQVALRIGRSR